MITLSANKIKLSICEEKGCIASLCLDGVERCAGEIPLFVARLRDKDGDPAYVNATEAKEADGLTYKNFGGDFSALAFSVTVTAKDAIEWRLAVSGVPAEYALEWVEFPKLLLPRLAANDPNGGRIVLPHDEGILISDETKFIRYEPEYPSSGAYLMYPNKMAAQFMAYLFDGAGIYIGAHDPARGLKSVDFYPANGGVTLQMRLYTGADYGCDFVTDYPLIWQACGGDWQSAARIYRDWFEDNLPPRVKKVKENPSLPKWYEEMPLIVTYPIRGLYDYDDMTPNAFFPYTNTLPILDKIKRATETQVMALLMHWEGSAPWAPPYVWPPYGGEELFNEFRDALHKNGDLIGVYCSGFGYTLQSTLIAEYNMEKEIKEKNLLRIMCHSPKNTPDKSIICTYQRVGYDICPACEDAKDLLDRSYAPVFQSGVDYAQILDQNHGGGQYLCYAREHGHPPMPGAWMTSNMQALLAGWNDAAPKMLFGCESAASEPFIGNLAFSDNRYELNYAGGEPVPVYAFLYHEYVRNFMGNQVGCPFVTTVDTLRYRLGYSFSIGDLMTLTLNPLGGLMTHWGMQDLENAPDEKPILAFIKNLMRFYREEAKDILYAGRMSDAADATCETVTFPMTNGRGDAILPRLLLSAWETEDGKTAYVCVNPESEPVACVIRGESYEIPALDARLIVL